ncbi:phage portal, SPP1 Gp6-like family protein [Geobacillus kaustophilus]|uniref:Phage portal, SPP1 Gp6-like family protein n=1 Tax=Geobacillus kaustophilus TaxID=1462 RepID=A0A0D8BTX3_GEOKU|nr:phage portal protein [Geobacillus kaustophilus]KJE27585.1 phage portal, SPP1 Gp6-like family protein [Geobacillus kaustophilus]
MVKTLNLQQYIKGFYDGRNDWFIEEVQSVTNQQRIMNVMNLKDYLNGQHKILQKQPYMYNGKEFHPRKIILQYAKTLLNFQTSFLLQHPITITGKERIVKEYQKVNKQGHYDRLNRKILDKMLKYGQVYEYVYLEGNKTIKSKLIDASEGFPVWNDDNEMIAFIQAYMVNGIDYYIVYSEDTVETYDNKGGELRLTGRYANLSGLPIVYKTTNEVNDNEGKSELEDWISILDNMEDLISKYMDTFYKFMDPIAVSIGQQLKGELPSEVVGKGINLDDGGEFYLEQNKTDYQTFQTLYKTLLQALLDISQTPAVSLNKTDISNLSEVSIKLLFQLAEIKASINEQYMREGIEQRFEKIRRLLEYKGVTFTDDEFDSLGLVFQYALPSSDKEIIENMKSLREIGGLSLQTMLEQNPYVHDVQQEMMRLKEEKGTISSGSENN